MQALQAQTSNKRPDPAQAEAVFKAVIGADGKIKDQYHVITDFLKITLHDISDL